uniref:Uncharacterized protein n=1 Tax=Lactuca sativa TaxID=4236 RepID=A0A9R1UR05_LACSA|nr:hypothetical protein LSAT_V11C800401370 [Lactuca sativa]
MQRLVTRQDLNVKSYYKKLVNLLKKIKLASNSKALKTTFGAAQVLTALATSFHALKPFKVLASVIASCFYNRDRWLETLHHQNIR